MVDDGRFQQLQTVENGTLVYVVLTYVRFTVVYRRIKQEYLTYCTYSTKSLVL